jgi:hypothetical protein
MCVRAALYGDSGRNFDDFLPPPPLPSSPPCFEGESNIVFAWDDEDDEDGN